MGAMTSSNFSNANVLEKFEFFELDETIQRGLMKSNEPCKKVWYGPSEKAWSSDPY